MGFSGLGSETADGGSPNGGTVYLVLSPREAWRQGMRYGFMGTGHEGEGTVQLGLTKNGDLELRVGGKATSFASALATPEWHVGTWYFIGASWQANGEPVLYVREMDPAAPAASPEAILGTPSGAAPQPSRPDKGPLVIGAHWYDPGADAASIHGSGSKIAYARFDNIHSTKEEMEVVFESLAAP